MRGKNQKPKPKPQPTSEEVPVTPTTTPVAPKVSETTEVNQMRKNLQNEIKELKKQVLLVQLQSMKVMQQSVHSLFKAQTGKTSEQIAQQNTDLQKQLEEETDTIKPAEMSNTKKTNDEINTGDEQIQKFNEIVLKAMQNAQQSVDSAMEAAQKIMGDAENILKGS